MATDRYALKKELLQTRAAAERLELRALTGRLEPAVQRGARLNRYSKLFLRLRSNPIAMTVTGAVLARLPFGPFWRLGSRMIAMAWAGWQLSAVFKDFMRK